jgi:tetratricopeptide (TPR) repeat protein
MASTTETGTHQASPNAGGFSVDKAKLKNRDEFFVSTYRFFDGLGKHSRGVAVAVVLLVGIGVAGGLMANRHQGKSEEGKNALFLAQKAYEAELKSVAGVKAPAPAAESKDPKAQAEAQKAQRAQEEASAKKLDDVAYQKLDVDAKFPESVKKYNDVIHQYAGTRAAHEARMALGTLYFNHGDPAKATPLFEAATGSASGSFEKSLALQSWGYALENSAKHAEAVSAYEKALNLGEAGIKGDLMLAIARCQEAMHDAAKARSTYDQILTQLPNTDAAKTAEALKAKLQ